MPVYICPWLCWALASFSRAWRHNRCPLLLNWSRLLLMSADLFNCAEFRAAGARIGFTFVLGWDELVFFVMHLSVTVCFQFGPGNREAVRCFCPPVRGKSA